MKWYEVVDEVVPIWYKLDQLGEKERDCVEWCMDYLLVENEIADEFDPYPGDSEWSNKCLSDRITDFLGIKDSDDLLSYMDRNELTEFGGSITCGWLYKHKDNPYLTRIVTDERREKIKNWIYAEN